MEDRGTTPASQDRSANAGISGRTPIGGTDEAVFENVIHTNLNGAFFTVNSAAPLLNDNGSIIFNGSVDSSPWRVPSLPI